MCVCVCVCVAKLKSKTSQEINQYKIQYYYFYGGKKDEWYIRDTSKVPQWEVHENLFYYRM